MHENEGLRISRDEFKQLPKDEQLACLHDNMCLMLQLTQNMHFHKKILYAMCAFLTGGMGFLYQFILTIKHG